jgi:hypothetical protein
MIERLFKRKFRPQARKRKAGWSGFVSPKPDLWRIAPRSVRHGYFRVNLVAVIAIIIHLIHTGLHYAIII